MIEAEEWRHPGFRRLVYLSLLVAILLKVLPLPYDYFFWLPDWAAMMLFFWVIHHPSRIHVGSAFVVGICIDFFLNVAVGSHALAYVCAVFLLGQKHKQIAAHDFAMQSLIVFGAALLVQSVLTLIYGLSHQIFTGWRFLVSPLVMAAFWPPLNKLIIKLLSLQRIK